MTSDLRLRRTVDLMGRQVTGSRDDYRRSSMGDQLTYNLADQWEAVSDRVADREAVVCGDRRLTYAQLEERANRLADRQVRQNRVERQEIRTADRQAVRDNQLARTQGRIERQEMQINRQQLRDERRAERQIFRTDRAMAQRWARIDDNRATRAALRTTRLAALDNRIATQFVEPVLDALHLGAGRGVPLVGSRDLLPDFGQARGVFVDRLLQFLVELGPRGVHTLLVSPGPIARDDARERYSEQAADLPQAAHRPGGGAQLKAIPPELLAAKILRACESRRPELVIPGKTKLLFSLAQLWPTFADWILQKNTEGD